MINPLWCPPDGRLIEPRGDEALAMQARFAEATRDEPDLPPDVGSGLDAGEAAPVEDSYRAFARFVQHPGIQNRVGYVGGRCRQHGSE